MPLTENMESVDGVEMYRISPLDDIDPFLMTIVSNSDLWMFLSSTGGLTAGRVEPERCIFPYETDDRLHHLSGRVGPITVLRVHAIEPHHGVGAVCHPWPAHEAQPAQERARQRRGLRGTASRTRTHAALPLGTVGSIRSGAELVR